MPEKLAFPRVGRVPAPTRKNRGPTTLGLKGSYTVPGYGPLPSVKGSAVWGPWAL